MGVVLPGWADEALNVIGISWPNVDEDDYREMATAMREFADDVEDGVTEAHNAVLRLVSAGGGGMATEALNAHWDRIKSSHLANLAESGRLTATALDGVALLIEGAKGAALVQLGILAAQIAAAAAAAPFTFGLSALGGLAGSQAVRMAVKRIFSEVAEQVAARVVEAAMGPIFESLGSMAGDLVVNLGTNAALDDEDAGMELLSAGGGGDGGKGGFSFDPEEYERVGMKLQGAGDIFRSSAGGKINKAKERHGRTRGKDPIADAANVMLDRVIDGVQQASTTAAKHLDDSMRRGVKRMADNHQGNDTRTADRFSGLTKTDHKPLDGPRTGGGSRGPGGNGPGGRGGRGPGGPSGPRPGDHRSTDGPARGGADRDPRGTSRPGDAVKDCGDPVDVATGRVFLQQTDLTLNGTLPLVFGRRYESSYRAGRLFGPSWSSTADQRLESDRKGVVLVREDGLLLAYPHPGPDPGEPVLPVEGPRWPLARTEDGGCVVTDPDSGLVRYFGPTDGPVAPLEELTDRNGNRISFDHDEDGVLTGICHSGGYHLLLTTENSRITALRLAGAADGGGDQLLLTYGYDESGNLAEVTDSAGRTTHFGYDGVSRLVSWTDTGGSRYEYVYDALDRCVYESGSDGHLRYSFRYGSIDLDTGHRVTTATDSLGRTTRYTINSALQVVAETDPCGAVTRMVSDRYDRVLSVTDPLSRTTRYGYDEAGNLTSLTFPDGRSATARYNDLGLPVSVTDPDGSVWYQEFDERGNRTAFTDAAGATTRYTHRSDGAPATVTDALGHTVHLSCDAAGLPVSVTDPLGAVTRYRRNAFGRTAAITDPLGETTAFSWTVEGHLSARVDPDGTTERWTWDGEGNCLTHTDGHGSTTRLDYTHFDQLATRTGPDGARYEFHHDTELQLTQVVNPQGLAWSYRYDPAGRIVSETDFDGRTLSYGYDAAGRLTTRTNALDQTISYEYDELDRVTTKDADGAQTVYTYDAAGGLQRVLGPDCELALVNDAMGRVLSETVDGRTLSTSYDLVGNRVRRTTPSGATSTWTYDAAGRTTALRTPDHAIGFTHDTAGREVGRRFGDLVTLDRTYDRSGRLTGQSLRNRTGVVQRRAYHYRADGNLTGVDDLLGGSRTFDLDAAGRVTGVQARDWTESYAYDSAGNQTFAHWPEPASSGSASPAPAQGERGYSGTRIVGAGRIRFEHDAQGRITVRQRTRLSRKPDTWRYSWDAEDRLTQVTTPDGTRWRYRYDPLGRRVAKARLDAAGAVAEETLFTWDGVTLAEQTTVSAAAEPVTLTWDHEDLAPVAQRESRGAGPLPSPRTAPQSALESVAASDPERGQHEVDRRFFAIVTDLVGAPTELADADGNIAWQARSSVWGNTTGAQDSTASTPLRFPGQYFDEETGLHYNLHRYYDPQTARYASPDPLGLVTAPNPVAYVDNPHTWSDPLGLGPCKKPHNVAPKYHPYKGGRYKDLKDPTTKKNVPGTEINHMPPNSVNGLPRDKGPAIQMDKNDHYDTASWGRSKEAMEYRKKQQDLMAQGKQRDAIEMDIKDIKSKFPGKYDKAIDEMMKDLPKNW